MRRFTASQTLRTVPHGREQPAARERPAPPVRPVPVPRPPEERAPFPDMVLVRRGAPAATGRYGT
ncbi:hypothetical protein [Streptomyces sp. NPDC001889]